MDFGDAAIIAGDQAVEDLGQPQPRLADDAAHDAEVDRGDPPVRQREQVPLMEIGVEEAVDDRLAQERLDQGGGELAGIVPRGDDRGAIRKLDAVDPFQRHHPAGGAPPIDRGHVEAGHRRHVLGQFGGGGGLAPQVQLAQRPLAEAGDDEAGAQARELAAHRIELGGGPFVGIDRAGEILLDPRAQHLDRDRAPLGGDRAMDLRDRGGADRLGIEHRICGLERLAEAALHRGADQREGEGGHRILEPREIQRRRLPHQIGAGGERLAELDRGRADRLEGIGIARLLGSARTDPRDAGEAAHGRRRVRVALDPAQRAVAGKRAAPAHQAPQVDDGRGHMRAIRSSSRCGSRRARRGSVRRAPARSRRRRSSP